LGSETGFVIFMSLPHGSMIKKPFDKAYSFAALLVIAAAIVTFLDAFLTGFEAAVFVTVLVTGIISSNRIEYNGNCASRQRPPIILHLPVL
jgi:hypothetical protein